MTNFYKILFTLTMTSGTLVSISSYSWMGMWMGLEINLLSLIPLLKQENNNMSSESALKYFLTQAMASMIFIFSMIIMMLTFKMNTNFNLSSMNTLMMNSALLTKMGAAPFHFWLPEIVEGLSWINCLIILTWQKIAPMVLLMYNMNTTFFSMIITACMVISSIMAMNQTSMRKIMAYSSINHMGWMIAAMMTMETLWTYYFMIYVLMNLNIIMILQLFNINQFKQIFMFMENNFFMKLLFMMNFMSLGGLPPFIGFFPKWLIIQALSNSLNIIMLLIMISFTLAMLFIYIRLMFSSMVMNSSMLKTSVNSISFKPSTIALMNFTLIISLIMCTLLFNWI